MSRAALLPLLAVLAAAPSSAGGVLMTPPVHAENATVMCGTTYSGDESTSAIATLYNSSAAVLDGGVPTAVDPGVSQLAVAINTTGYFYCTFQGLTKGMRGYILLIVDGQSELVLPASR
jgi:hypothetical protein